MVLYAPVWIFFASRIPQLFNISNAMFGNDVAFLMDCRLYKSDT